MKNQSYYCLFSLFIFIVNVGYSQNSKITYVSNESGNWDIWTCNIDGSNRKKITDYSGPDYNPTWSPDGTKIAFTTYRWGGHRIGIMDSNGTNVKRFLSQSEGYNLAPDWSPNGKFLTYFREYKGYWQIFKTNIKTGVSKRLSNISNTSDRSPKWSPDGTKIAFQSVRDGNWEIYIMDKDGNSLKRLTNNSHDDFMPSWSPDGKEIVFGSSKNGQLDIYTIKVDGSQLKNITNGKPITLKANSESHKDDLSPIFSPDGKSIIWSHGSSGQDAQIFIMDKNGGSFKSLLNTRYDERFPSTYTSKK